MELHPNAAAATPPDQLAGDRIVVRAFRMQDAPAMFQAVVESRERLRPWMDWVDNHRAVADTEEYCARVIERFAARSDFALGIFERETGAFLGGIGLHNIRWDVPTFEIGYWLRDGAVGNGYVEEAVRLIIRHVFGRMGCNRLMLTCDANNVRSRRIPEQIGFVLEGRLRNHMRTNAGTLRDTMIYSLTPDDAAATSSIG